MINTIEKYSWVDSFSGYAMLLMMLIHPSQHLLLLRKARFLTYIGDLGVELFYIVSSFTLFNYYSKIKIENSKYVKRSHQPAPPEELKLREKAAFERKFYF